MKFAALLARTQRHAAAVFSPREDGQTLLAWFPATSSSSPQTGDEYTVDGGPATSGPMRSRTVEQLALIGVSGETRSVALSLPLPYVPDKQTTTFLLGITKETAARFRVVEFRNVGAVLELDAEEIEALPFAQEEEEP